MPDITPEPILKIARGFMAAKYLFVASEIQLFEALARGPASLDELANKTGVPSRTLGIVTAAMVSLGLIERDDSRYRIPCEGRRAAMTMFASDLAAGRRARIGHSSAVHSAGADGRSQYKSKY
jgi:hypothetical protein